jgi:hypothetical protein
VDVACRPVVSASCQIRATTTTLCPKTTYCHGGSDRVTRPSRLDNVIGPHTAAVIQHLLGARKHPQQAYRACLGVLRMGKDYGRERLEAACRRAIDLKAPNYKFIASTLKNGLDREPEMATVQADLPLMHANVRGPSYYH